MPPWGLQHLSTFWIQVYESTQAVRFPNHERQVIGCDGIFRSRNHFKPLVVALQRHDPESSNLNMITSTA